MNLSYEGLVEISKAEGCYGTIDLLPGPRLADDVDIVDELYSTLGLGDGTVDGFYPYRRFKARIVIEVLSDVETAPYADPAEKPVLFDPPPPPAND